MGIFVLLLSTSELTVIDSQLLFLVLKEVLEYAPLDPQSLEITKACFPHVFDQIKFIDLLVKTATKISMT